MFCLCDSHDVTQVTDNPGGHLYIMNILDGMVDSCSRVSEWDNEGCTHALRTELILSL